MYATTNQVHAYEAHAFLNFINVDIHISYFVIFNKVLEQNYNEIQ